MSPAELWWYIEAKKGVDMYGSLTEEDAESLYLLMQAKGV